jgi:hypothetical protein
MIVKNLPRRHGDTEKIKTLPRINADDTDQKKIAKIAEIENQKQYFPSLLAQPQAL